MVVVETQSGGQRRMHEPTPQMRRFRVLMVENGLRAKDIATALRPAGLFYSQIWGMLQGIYGHPVTEGKKAALCAALSEVLGRPVAESEIWGEAVSSSDTGGGDAGGAE